MIKYLIPFFMITSLFSAQEVTDNKINETNSAVTQEYNPNVDCLILEDENSIICKFEVVQDQENEQAVTINWINPNGEISRSRDMMISAGDSSAYDFRYIDGREIGIWNFKIIYKEKEYSTKFEIK